MGAFTGCLMRPSVKSVQSMAYPTFMTGYTLRPVFFRRLFLPPDKDDDHYGQSQNAGNHPDRRCVAIAHCDGRCLKQPKSQEHKVLLHLSQQLQVAKYRDYT